jgi:hypothetical protein
MSDAADIDFGSALPIQNFFPEKFINPPLRARRNISKRGGAPMRYLLTGALIFVLAGCAQLQAERQRERQEQERQDFDAVRAELRSAIAGNPKIDPIRSKISLHDSRAATLQMLASSEYLANENEKAALEEWQALVNAGLPKFRGLLQRYSPWVSPLYESLRADGLTLVSDLYAGKITYGQYNRQRLETFVKFQQAVDERRRELQREQARMRQAQAMVDAQQSLAASAALASFNNYLLGQQLINQQMQPTRIAPFSCTRYGNTTSCY